MNAKKAKKLRKQIYGDSMPQGYFTTKSGKVVADPRRRIYQKLKKALRGK